MIEDKKEWTKPVSGVTHKVIGGIQYTISDYTNFAELMVYSWHSYNVVEKRVFFVRSLGDDCYNCVEHYWNCGTIEKAIEWAKHYITGCYEMEIRKNNLMNFEYHLSEHR
jgi:hypothetical protein